MRPFLPARTLPHPVPLAGSCAKPSSFGSLMRKDPRGRDSVAPVSEVRKQAQSAQGVGRPPLGGLAAHPLTHALLLLPAFIPASKRSFHTGRHQLSLPPCLLCCVCLLLGLAPEGSSSLGPRYPLWQLTEAPEQFARPCKGPGAGELEDKGPGTGALAVVLELKHQVERARTASWEWAGDGMGSGWYGGKPGILPGGGGCREPLLSQPSVPWLLRRPLHGPCPQPLGDVELVEFPKLCMRHLRASKHGAPR